VEPHTLSHPLGAGLPHPQPRFGARVVGGGVGGGVDGAGVGMQTRPYAPKLIQVPAQLPPPAGGAGVGVGFGAFST
jgi:hypothetical protein